MRQGYLELAILYVSSAGALPSLSKEGSTMAESVAESEDVPEQQQQQQQEDAISSIDSAKSRKKKKVILKLSLVQFFCSKCHLLKVLQYFRKYMVVHFFSFLLI